MNINIIIQHNNYGGDVIVAAGHIEARVKS